jgi:hypothetical protein
MKRNRILSAMVAVLLLTAGGIQPVSAFGQSPAPQAQDADLSGVILSLSDLPAGFEPMSASQVSSMGSMMRSLLSELGSQSQVETINLVGYQKVNLQDRSMEMVASLVLTPMSLAEQIAYDQAVANPSAIIQLLSDQFGVSDAATLSGVSGLGQRSFGIGLTITSGSISVKEEVVSFRRKYVVVQVVVASTSDQPLPIRVQDLAQTLDQRLIAVVGGDEVTPFRAGGPLVPEITTYIPTPLDVSREPSVIGTNLLFAALLMVLFAVAAEIFTRTLSENEEALRDRFKPVVWISNLQARLDAVAGSRLQRSPRLMDTLKIVGVMIFYGLVFSLLDREWNPFSLKGLILFGSMTIAYGLVGIADDIFQWRAIRKWGLAAELTVRPTNVLLALGSTAASRLLTLIPGLMFGTPEALRTDENQFDAPQRGHLLRISAVTFTVIGLSVWLPTLITDILQRASAFAEETNNILGGIEGFLLVVFAVALENLFVQTLGLPGSFGEALKKRSRRAWLAVMIGVGFVFYHTLINPRGDLAGAIQNANVQLFFAVGIIFVALAFGVRWYIARQYPRVETPAAPAPPPAIGVAPAVAEKTAPSVQVVSTKEIPADSRLCPHCGNVIKCAARLCRYCQNPVTPIEPQAPVVKVAETLQGEIPADSYPCPHCGNVIKRAARLCRFCQQPLTPVEAPASAQSVEASPVEIPADSHRCPNCGNVIKLEARLCRFCRIRFEVDIVAYCQNCHAINALNDAGRCIRCNGEVIDRQIKSTPIRTSTTQ